MIENLAETMQLSVNSIVAFVRIATIQIACHYTLLTNLRGIIA